MKKSTVFILLALGAFLFIARKPIMNVISRLTDEGVKLLKKFEGFSATVYKDIAGLPTIGYGHLIRPGETFTRITEAQADALLRQDVNAAEAGVQRALKPETLAKLSPNQYNALVSLAYNIGTGAFAKSTLVKLLNQGFITQAGDQFVLYNKVRQGGQLVASKGLTNRRLAEQALFRTA